MESIPNANSQKDSITHMDEDQFLDSDESTEEVPVSDEQDLGTAEDTLDESEAHRGYLRQRDYTIKTQALAEQRKALQALQADLAEAKALADWVKSNPAAQRALRAVVNGETDEYVDPDDLKVSRAEQSAQEALSVARGLHAELRMEKAIASHGLVATTDDLAEFMAEHGISKPETAAKLMSAEQRELSKSAAKAAITDQKRGGLPHAGTARRAAQSKVDYSKMSYEDILEEAMAEFGR